MMSIEQTTDRDDPFKSLLGYHLRRLSVVTMADLAASLASLGLTPTAASVLFVVGANPGLTQSDVGKTLGVLRANMTPLVARLMNDGLLERDRKDGRSQSLRLSQSGLKSRRQAWKATQDHEKRLFGTLSPAARARLVMQLSTLWQAQEPEIGVDV